MRLYVLQYAFREEDGNPIPGYLIVTDDQQYILVDTGFPTLDSGMFVADFVKPEDDVRQQLALMDLRPDDIDILICTHFDPDHAGAHHLFTAAELIVQRQHYEFVHNETIDRFESIVEIMLELARYESKLKKLSEQIRKLSNQYRVLDQRVLPDIYQKLRKTIQYIDEREREEYYRLKKYKDLQNLKI